MSPTSLSTTARVIAALALSSLAAACGPDAPPLAPLPKPPPSASAAIAPPAPTVRVTPDAPFRAKAPEPNGEVTFVAPKVVSFTLKNGVKVLLTERHDLPVVAVRFVVKLGAGDVPDARPGALSMLGSMLEQGTKTRSALAVSDDFDAIGAAHGAWFDWDAGGTSIHVLSDKLDRALEIMSDVTLAPTFPSAELERLRSRRIAALSEDKSHPSTMAHNAGAAAIFGPKHPYGTSLYGREADAKALTRAELVRLYDRLVTPSNVAIVACGDVTPAALEDKLGRAFGAWRGKPGGAKRQSPKAPAKPGSDKRLVFVDKDGAQSQVWLTHLGVPFDNPDREALRVMNAILGGMFSSRINLNLRERNAFTYGARSYFTMRHGAGPFMAGASVFADKTGPAIQEIMSEIEKMRADGPSDDELSLAKESILLGMPGRFEGAGDVTWALADLVAYDLPLDHFETRPKAVAAVTKADVLRVAQRYLTPDKLKVVVVGGRAKVMPQLEPLKLGPPDERDAWGTPVPTPKH